MALLVGMGPDGHDGQLRIPGDDGGDGRAFNAQSRRTEVTEDQGVIQHQIHQHRADAGDHGNHRLAGFTKGAGVSIAQGERKKSPDHDVQIPDTVFHDLRGIRGIAVTGQIQADEEPVTGQKYCSAQRSQRSADENLEPEGVSDTFVVPVAMELSSENAGTGAAAEDTQVEHEQQAVDDGNTGHGQCAHLTHHDVVQQIDKIGNAVLNDDGDGHQ